jgi:hypothetical protein
MTDSFMLVRCNRCMLTMQETHDEPVFTCHRCQGDDALMDLGSPPTRNPYPTRKGFGLRVANARRALRRLGEGCLANVYTRGFDACFEMFDGDAVVWALMHAALSGDLVLERGIRNMGDQVWPQWLAVYHAAPATRQNDDALGLV